MDINYIAIPVAAVAQFIIGAIWYMPIFGKAWGKIHHFEQHSEEEQKQMRGGMWKLMVAQFAVTLVTTVVLAVLRSVMPTEWNMFGLAGLLWLGFVVPTQVSAMLFGGTDPKWVVQKITIMAGGSLACLLAAALVFTLF